jgi:hypothetical protein
MEAHPYRSPARPVDDAPPCAPTALGIGLAVAQLCLLGWALVRVAVCTVRGLDLEGALAVTVVATVALALADPSRQEPSS